MIFHFVYALFLTIFLANFNCIDCHERDKHFNRTLFAFHDVKQCAKNEFFDINYFTCVPCQVLGENLQPSIDKFTCACRMSSLSPTVTTIYDTVKTYRTCGNICNNTQTKLGKNVTILTPQYCQAKEETLPKLNCKFKYINRTRTTAAVDFSRSIEMANLNWQYDGQCERCDLQYNFHYQDYCIANGLLRPFLNYNSFWQATTQHFGDLKFVAFFCMALNNNTACHHLANLCVLSFYSFDKNSPCSKFLLSQATDVVYRYGSADEQMSHQQIKPFLYYRKGKDMAKELRETIKDVRFSLDEHDKHHNRLQFFSVSYALDGTLRRWGNLKFGELILCPYLARASTVTQDNFIRFGKKYDVIECDLSLAYILDLAKMYGNQRFMSLFLNYTRKGKEQMLLHSVPILIEDITLENKRPQKEDWQLVKRFQMIEIHPRHGSISSKVSPAYEDEHKLLLYRSLRYVEKIQLHYDIHSDNHISIPVLKLRYRHIEFTNNTTLEMPLKFQFIISNDRISRDTVHAAELVNEIALPLLLLLALIVAFVRARNTRKRRCPSGTNDNEDFCHFAYFTEFLLHLISYMALAFLLCFLLCITINSLTYLTQSTLDFTLPLIRDQRSLELIIYAALVLKLIFVSIYFWRLSHFNIFFIDWERPRCGDTNHFNVKNNLETSSVCSSVRTYISDSNVSAWRSIFLANEWLRLSGKQKTSTLLQCVITYVVVKFFNILAKAEKDITLEIFFVSLVYLAVYVSQYLLKMLLLIRIWGNPLKKYTDHCSLANISVFALVEPSYGYYIHGRSPHGFADSDMTTMLMQLQRETHSISGRRGLLSDTDQCYTIMPPKNLSNYFDKLLLPYQRSFGGGAGTANFQKEVNTVEGSMEKTSIAYTSVNRFFCAFIDHGIKDMDYIIKEKTFVESLFNCEFENYLTDNKGTFYIDNCYSFGEMFLYGNELQIFILQFLLFLAVYLMCNSLLATVIAVYLFNKIVQWIFVGAVMENLSTKTLIDKRFLM
uniref:Meckelin n=1 Tax=Stomoxys calcitrans TaxID=35570 RepID=A0A1I8Q9F9_STOCA